MLSKGEEILKIGAGEKGEDRISADIYILFEHKSYQDRSIYFQLLRYMYLMWQEDIREGRELRVIVPYVFYHGRGRWRLEREFKDVFDVEEEVKRYILNYRYILFDTNDEEMFGKVSRRLRDNFILLGDLMLMKDIYKFNKKVFESVLDVFVKARGREEFFDELIRALNYVVMSTEIREEDIISVLDKKELKGGEIVPSLARRWYEEGKEIGLKEGIEKGIEKGEYEKAKRVARNMLMMGLGIDVIVKATGLSEEEVKKIAKEVKESKN